MKLFAVNVTILLDANNENNALNKVEDFLSGKSDLDMNYLFIDVEKDEYYDNLENLRTEQQA